MPNCSSAICALNKVTNGGRECERGRRAIRHARVFISYRSTNYGRHNLLTDYGYGSTEVPLADLDSALDRLGLGDRRVLV